MEDVETADPRELYDSCTPIQDVFAALAERVGRGNAVTMLFNRLEGGLIVPLARDILVQKSHRQEPPRFVEAVPTKAWKILGERASRSDVWVTGDLVVIELSARLYDGGDTYKYLGIRIHPLDLADLLPAPAASLPATTTIPDEAREKMPRVSSAMLDGWADLFRRAYKPEQITEDLAIRSANGMFPDKFVPRQEVRNRLPARKRGRPEKPKSD